MNVKLAAAGIVAALVLLVGALFGFGLFGHNNTTTFQIVQPVQGEAWVRDKLRATTTKASRPSGPTIA